MNQNDLVLLQTSPPYHLQAIVKARRLPVSVNGQNVKKPNDPSSMTITEIAQYLFDPTSCIDTLNGLAEMEKSILQELIACGGRANSRDLALYFSCLQVHLEDASEPDRKSSSTAESSKGSSRAQSHHRLVTLQYPTPHPHGVSEQAVHRLLLLGLLFWGKQTNFVGRDYASGVYDGMLIVPRTVLEIADELWNTIEREPSHVQTSEQDTSKGLETIGEGVSEGITTLQRYLYRYWSLVAAMREGLPLVNSRLLSRPSLRLVVDQLSPQGASAMEQVRTESDVPQFLFIRLLLMKLSLLSERRGALFATPADMFFSLPLLERARRCYHAWLDTTFWNELAYTSNIILRPGPAPLEPAHEEVVHSRQQVMERLLAENVGEWLEFSTFITRTRLYTPYLLFPRQSGTRAERYTAGINPYNWDFRLRRGWLTPREGWYLVEGGFIRALITGPLHWLGLVNVDADHPDAFRMVPDLALITGETLLEIQEPSWGRLVVQPNFEVIALAPVSEALLLNLDRFAERIRLEHIAQYRLTRASVTHAIQSGLQAETIQQILEQAADGSIPQNVQYSLIEWERQARRIELWRGVTLLEVDDAALLDQLLADAETRPLFGRRLAPLLVEVLTDQLLTVQEILWQRDYLPALVSASMYDNLLANGRLPFREPQWRLLHNGLLQPCHAVLNLYLVAEVERITVLDEETGWRKITAEAIQQACNSGLSLDHIVRFLQHYCQGGVPASFLIRLKLWGNGYEQQTSIGIEHTPLLRLSDQALQDIQADEEIGPLIDAEVPSDARLVRVPTEALDRVMELLKDRGFTVE
ncbi:MAG TPA: helicase-associated domain-containing protein [Ktedonobacteraceae bacterium]